MQIDLHNRARLRGLINTSVLLVALSFTALSHAENISDSYASGDTLTAAKMNNIKTAVNSKQDLIAGACTDGTAIIKINPNGTVECGAMGSTNAVTLEGIAATGFVKSEQKCDTGTITGFDNTGAIICSTAQEKQNRITGACEAGQSITSVNQDGTVECGITASTNAVTLEGIAAAGFVKSEQECAAGTITGFDNTGTIVCSTDQEKQNRITGSCEAGQVITAINKDGSVSCNAGGAGSDLNADRLDGFESTDFASADQACESGIIKGIDNQGTLICDDEIYFLANFGNVALSTESGLNHTLSGEISVIENTSEAFDGARGVFTAPATGAYLFTGHVNIQEPGNGFSSVTLTMRVVAGAHKYNQTNYEAAGFTEGRVSYNFSVLAKMEAGQTAFIEYLLTGNPRSSYSVIGSGSNAALGQSYFSGTRLY